MDLTPPQRLHLLSHHTDKNRFDPVSAACRGQLLRTAVRTAVMATGRDASA